MENIESKEEKTLLSIILGIYVVLVGVGLPIAVRDRYFDILTVKYYFYWICTVSMIILSLIYLVVMDREAVLAFLKNFSAKSVMKKMTAPDYAVLVFLLAAIVSTLSSDYLYESFWGNEGRFTGLFLLSLYVISYFLVSRFWIYESYYVDALLIVGMFVCIFGITDYFQMDIFHFKAPMLDEQKAIFTSTIGNINTYTAYVGIIAAISTVLFATIEDKKKVFLYYFCMVISFFAIIMGVSDNAYISLAALFSFLPLYLFSNKKGIRKYLLILATFFSVIQVISWINFFFKDTVLGIDSVFNMIADSHVLLYLVIGLWSMIILLNIIDHIRKPRYQKKYGNLFRYIWLALIFAVVLFLIYAVYDCSILGNTECYGKIGSYFVFNDDWGTHRGYIWRNAIEEFSGFSLWKKLIGYGPETFGILLINKTAGNPYNQIFDSAHNEYLQFLLTTGIVGLISYVIFILTCIKKCFSNGKKNPFIIAVAFGIICYSAQAFVNLSLPIVTPVFWLLLGMGSVKIMK